MKKISSRSRGLFIVDVEYSALWRSANHHCNQSSLKLVSATSFSSPLKLAKFIIKHNPDYLIFSWREAFDAIFSNKKCRRIILDKNPLVFLLIPDHLGLDRYIDSEIVRCVLADVVLTTSKRLEFSYRKLLPNSQTGILHDIPDKNELSKIESMNFKRNDKQLIWVGNSEWGKRLGIYDHKGLKRYAEDITSKVQEVINGVSLHVVDSAKSAIKYEKVLELLAKSSCLIVTSDSEGTCLPILEATALGTPVITFDVGIANEIFRGELQNKFIANRDISEAAKLVIDSILNFNEASRVSRYAWESYYQHVSGDLTRLLSQNFSPSGKWRDTQGVRVSRLIWYLRWLKNRYLEFIKK